MKKIINKLIKIFYPLNLFFINKSLLGLIGIKLIKISKNKFQIIDNKYDEIYISRLNRCNIYINGIENRLNKLYKSYTLNNVPINRNDIVIDCGSNIGEFSIYISKKFGCKVFSFEPELIEFDVLNENTKNLNITTINKALSNKNGNFSLYSKNVSGDSSLIDNGSNHIKKINTIKLDDYIENETKIKLFKLEAEGFEPEILEGSIKTLKSVEYVACDCGPERGITNEFTFNTVYKFLINQNFSLINSDLNRYIFLFKKNNAL